MLFLSAVITLECDLLGSVDVNEAMAMGSPLLTPSTPMSKAM